MIKALEQLRIETLKNTSDLVRNHNETCCAICIENFETGSQVRYLTCGHPYHKKVTSCFSDSFKLNSSASTHGSLKKAAAHSARLMC